MSTRIKQIPDLTEQSPNDGYLASIVPKAHLLPVWALDFPWRFNYSGIAYRQMTDFEGRQK